MTNRKLFSEDNAFEDPYANPRSLERDAIRLLLTQAWSGATPDL
jgi:hypothetical protein